MSTIALSLLFSTAALGADLEPGKHEWVFKIQGRTQQIACEMEVKEGTFLLRAPGKDPIAGKVEKGVVTFGIDNDANFMKGTGKLDEQGHVTGEMSWGQGGRVVAQGTFVLAPVNTAEQLKAFEKRLRDERPKLALPKKREAPEVLEHAAEELADTLGKLKIAAPELRGKMKLKKVEVSPVTHLYRFDFSSGEVGVLISTRMRDDRPKDDSAVVRQEPRFNELRNVLGADVMHVRPFGVKPNRMVEVTLLNAVDSEFFPMSLSAEASKTLDTVALSHTFAKAERYLECAVLLKNFDAETEEALLERGGKLLTAWRESLEVVK